MNYAKIKYKKDNLLIMNLVFIKGKIIEKVEFKFIYSKNKTKNTPISIVQTKVELDNKSIIDVIGYNEKADWMYRNLTISEVIYIEGELINNKQENNNLKVQVISIQ